jgi:tetratricopeptide (TPR) repeat protein
VAALLGGIGFLPLFGGPGYEAALAAGLVLPSAAAVAVAFDVAGERPRPFDALGRGAAAGGMFATIAFALTLLHGLRAGFCDVWRGTLLFALGPGAGAILGGAWGGFAGLSAAHVARRRRRVVAAVCLALAGPLGGIAVSLWRFYTSPMVFAYDPFFGLFAGPLYDTVIRSLEPLATYRLGSLASLGAAVVLALHLEWRGERLGFAWIARPGVALVGALALVASVSVTLFGARLGHYSTSRSIARALGRSLDSKRCRVVYDRTILERDARLVGRQCDAHVAAIERYFATRGPARITVFLFASAKQKGRLMGASGTDIAKPWRHEVYVQAAPYPHPILGHELAHVIAGSFGEGPFHVSGPLGGWVPDPGRIEGVAVAAAPPDDANLTLEQWARAMLDLKLLPDLHGVFRLSFLAENSSVAYTVAGAFVSWFHRVYGAGALRAWYGGAPLERVTRGKDLGALARDWKASLAKVVVPPEAMNAARARFGRPAIFGRRCPHVVDRLGERAGARLAENDYLGARRAYREMLELDPDDRDALMGLGRCAVRAGDEDAARRRYEAVASDSHLTRLAQADALEALGDLDLADGRVEQARQRYASVAKLVVDEDHLRTLDVKEDTADADARAAIVALLIGDARLGTSFGVAASRLATWAAADPDDGTPDYLLAKNLYVQGRWQEAGRDLDAALARQLSLERVRREAWRLRVVLSCAEGDTAGARRAFARWQAQPGVSQARQAGMARIMARCQTGS